jgi:hypothetical protein
LKQIKQEKIDKTLATIEDKIKSMKEAAVAQAKCETETKRKNEQNLAEDEEKIKEQQ